MKGGNEGEKKNEWERNIYFCDCYEESYDPPVTSSIQSVISSPDNSKYVSIQTYKEAGSRGSIK